MFFLPSYNEGMPMSVLDAMGYGLPIVSTNVGGIPKIVHNGENGFCCEAGDIKTMAEGINAVLCERTNLEKMSKNSYQIVNNGYSLEHHLMLIESVYNSQIDARKINVKN